MRVSTMGEMRLPSFEILLLQSNHELTDLSSNVLVPDSLSAFVSWSQMPMNYSRRSCLPLLVQNYITPLDTLRIITHTTKHIMAEVESFTTIQGIEKWFTIRIENKQKDIDSFRRCSQCADLSDECKPCTLKRDELDRWLAGWERMREREKRRFKLGGFPPHTYVLCSGNGGSTANAEKGWTAGGFESYREVQHYYQSVTSVLGSKTNPLIDADRFYGLCEAAVEILRKLEWERGGYRIESEMELLIGVAKGWALMTTLYHGW
ncbi:uncharacterized protein PAC_03191 [Phialocephala subalpina]|uniref:Uncharacterized protein n=1 Tax=Phialocephala subalpina TaxID=576137 RepID=A0A1L7WKQ7_9HELO|nr:uncharacterized protein PAC_03191 [Phialocephala subalpina]